MQRRGQIEEYEKLWRINSLLTSGIREDVTEEVAVKMNFKNKNINMVLVMGLKQARRDEGIIKSWVSHEVSLRLRFLDCEIRHWTQ